MQTVWQTVCKLCGCTRAVRGAKAAPVCPHVPARVQEVCAEPPPSSAGQPIHYRDPKFIISSDKNIGRNQERSAKRRETACKQFANSLPSLANSLQTVYHDKQQFGKQFMKIVCKQFGKRLANSGPWYNLLIYFYLPTRK